MLDPLDGRDNIDDWYFVENQKRKTISPESFHNGPSKNDSESPQKRTKDFIANELHAMSTLSLYDDSIDKVKAPGEADKWVMNFINWRIIHQL